MSAFTLIEHLHLAGLTLEALADGGLHVFPANRITQEIDQLIVENTAALIDALKDEAAVWPAFVDPGTTPETLERLRAASRALDGAQVSRAASNEAEHAAGVGVSAKSLDGPDPDRWCWPHSAAMNTAEIETFNARSDRFTKFGLSQEDANQWAEIAAQRDREGDDRRYCLECAHLRPGRQCGNWRAAGVAIWANESQLPSELVLKLQRCGGYSPHSFQAPGEMDNDKDLH